ncbi:phosphotransferase enzyme family protein [Paenibacillus paeoniae]|uniref:Aminoglycoside phosphotransferase domain-containing protein n=1 Tax=Paenibacillus paeoniae TaxID=2292705 RepID=A0A371PGA5_9BACL|nr:phosphotransferase [Paenibacillus paeoniae]REK74991.1 hypothetical protein DX130_15240 [Paenibacillus paeoniae]
MDWSGIANRALSHYGVDVESLEAIAQSASMIYKVTDKSGAVYSLRLHQSKSDTLESYWSDPDVIRSEMLWLQALAEGTDLVLPVPNKNSRGEYITDVDGMPCSLLCWVEGEQKPFVPSADDARLVGIMMGKLHKQASVWQPPAAFVRPESDSQAMMEALGKVEPWVETGLLSEDIFNLLVRASERAQDILHHVERTAEHWGMIHGDLIPSNFLFHGQECRPIDFGACGPGYFLYDLAWSFSFIHPMHRGSLVDAYSEQFSLPPNYERLLEACFVMAQLSTLNFWLGLPDATSWVPEHLSKLASRECTRYIQDEPFLYSGIPFWE